MQSRARVGRFPTSNASCTTSNVPEPRDPVADWFGGMGHGATCVASRMTLVLADRWPARSRRRPPGYTHTYTIEDVVAALGECARELRRTPSSTAYRGWRTAANRRRRGHKGYPSIQAILDRYRNRGGWIAALEEAGLFRPPPHTIRISTPSKSDAARLASALRARGHVVAHGGRCSWIEFYGDVGDARLAVARSSGAVDGITLFDPTTRLTQEIGTACEPEI
jgi:hypothetical protein